MTTNKNFTAAVENAIATVAELLNEPVAKIAEEAMSEGPVRNSVMMLVCHVAEK